MFDKLFSVWGVLLALLLGALGFLPSFGCNAQAALDSGKLRIHYQPAIIWRVDTGVWLSGSSQDLIVLEGDVAGAATTEDGEEPPG